MDCVKCATSIRDHKQSCPVVLEYMSKSLMKRCSNQSFCLISNMQLINIWTFRYLSFFFQIWTLIDKSKYFDLKYSAVALSISLGSFPHWKLSLHFTLTSFTASNWLCSGIFLYLSSSIYQLTLTSFPVLAEQKSVHSIMLPPPCVMVCPDVQCFNIFYLFTLKLVALDFN